MPLSKSKLQSQPNKGNVSKPKISKQTPSGLGKDEQSHKFDTKLQFPLKSSIIGNPLLNATKVKKVPTNSTFPSSTSISISFVETHEQHEAKLQPISNDNLSKQPSVPIAFDYSEDGKENELQAKHELRESSPELRNQQQTLAAPSSPLLEKGKERISVHDLVKALENEDTFFTHTYNASEEVNDLEAEEASEAEVEEKSFKIIVPLEKEDSSSPAPDLEKDTDSDLELMSPLYRFRKEKSRSPSSKKSSIIRKIQKPWREISEFSSRSAQREQTFETFKKMSIAPLPRTPSPIDNPRITEKSQYLIAEAQIPQPSGFMSPHAQKLLRKPTSSKKSRESKPRHKSYNPEDHPTVISELSTIQGFSPPARSKKRESRSRPESTSLAVALTAYELSKKRGVRLLDLIPLSRQPENLLQSQTTLKALLDEQAASLAPENTQLGHDDEIDFEVKDEVDDNDDIDDDNDDDDDDDNDGDDDLTEHQHIQSTPKFNYSPSVLVQRPRSPKLNNIFIGNFEDSSSEHQF